MIALVYGTMITNQTETTPTEHASASAGWWAERDHSTWERVKEALHRDWEQTKNDITRNGGTALDQNAADTVKQMFGRQEIPDEQRANLSLAPDDEHLGLAFGHYARLYYGARYQAWTSDLDKQLAADWHATHPTLRYDDFRLLARYGYEHGARKNS